MQAPSLRYVFLIATLLVGAGLYAALGEPRGIGTPRWPVSDALYVVDGWSVGSQQNAAGGFVSRTFRSPTGHQVTLSIFSNQAPKLYGAGAEVPFLGNGYSVETVPADMAAALGDGVHALVARQGSDQWLVVYAYGERRGLLGNGPQAWTFALFDGIMGRPNDYYKLFLSVRSDGSNPSTARELIGLSRVVFPRIASFYAS